MITQWRSYLFVITGISTNLAVVYSLIFFNIGNRSVADYQFPAHLNLNNGQAKIVKLQSKQSKIKDKQEEALQDTKEYQYILNGQIINLKISYLVGTRGDVETYLQKYLKMTPTIKIKHLESIGDHALFTNKNHAYLSSCISPRSLSNVTQRQFSQQRYQNDLQLQVAWDWLQGKASIRDRRCLWILLSTPITPSNTQAAYQSLEIVWQDLYQWWLPNFPPLTK
ncbi:MAG: cyanoexosortase A system-associated protein [Waterburya sp.]